jgi:hypothetical protein
MGNDADSGGKVQAMVPPFIYLSDAMQQYASCKVPIASDVETAGDANSETQINFGWYLADKIKKKEVLLFDVHSLAPIFELELEEVLQFLRTHGSKDATTIALEKGRDYCLDGEKATHAIALISTEAPTWVTGRRKSKGRRAAESSSGQRVEDRGAELELKSWGVEKKYVTLEFLQLKLAEGRYKAQQEIPMNRSQRGPMGRSTLRELTLGATSRSEKFHDDGEDIYVRGTFNRSGLPALWLETTNPDLLVVWKAKKAKNARNAKHAMWQIRLYELYQRNKMLTHRELCVQLAKILNDQKGSHERTVNPETMRAVTLDPGERPRGGARMKRQASTK